MSVTLAKWELEELVKLAEKADGYECVTLKASENEDRVLVSFLDETKEIAYFKI